MAILRSRAVHLGAVVALAGLVLGACGDDEPSADRDTTTTSAAGLDEATTRRVPDEYPTIQEAVDAAEPGDLVFIAAGTYDEAVVVQTENLVIRGEDRNGVILDGGFEKENGFIVFSNGVAIENLTVRNFTSNGLFWTGDYDADRTLTGYRASYVTAHNNGDYGIYAFNATKGQLDHTYASGSPDASYYIGQCNPCDTLLVDVVGENSMLGYSGENSTGVTIARSEFKNNIIGLVPSSQDGEKLAPNDGGLFVGNYIHDNNNPAAPGYNDDFRVGHGSGVILIGTQNNVVERNTIVRNDRFGVIVLPWIADVFGGSDFDVIDNVVRNNYVRGAEGGTQLALALLDSSDTLGNCFEDNDFETSLPEDLQTVAPCEGTPQTGFATVDQYIDRFVPGPPFIPYEDVPAPAYEFDSMPDAATAPARPATDIPMALDVDTIERPPDTGA
jgi:Right handed beta helix region